LGNFYTNFLVVGPGQAEVAEFLSTQRRSAYITPSAGGVVVIYDEACDTQDVDEITSLGCTLSEHFNCPIVSSLNHDDDHLFMHLFVNGKQEAAYIWFLQAFSASWSICRHVRQLFLFPFLAMILFMPYVIFEVDRHQLIARLMGWPLWVLSGYSYIDHGELPPGLVKDSLIKTSAIKFTLE
jgi:hypothetical protein